MRRLRTAAVAVALLLPTLGQIAPAAAYPETVVTLSGRGFGHGRGLGQYGALGYALDHGWSAERILGHYYGGTTEGTVKNGDVHVRLVQNDGRDLIVRSSSPFTIAGTAFQPQQVARVRSTGLGTWDLDTASTCAGDIGGIWTPVRTGLTGQPEAVPVTLDPGEDRAKMLQVCLPEGIRWFRGTVRAAYADGTTSGSDTVPGPRTVNKLPIESYLRGVVPRESPASWGDLGGGAGMQALRAQSVAARSYVVAEQGGNTGKGRYGYAQTCNTESCQVYGGVALQQGEKFFALEDRRTDSAIASTAGVVRRNAAGSVARTEFSSSTGGHTAGGVFPSVPDAGDATPRNPNRSWNTAIAVSAVETKFGAGKGALDTMAILTRNGLGPDGGRVLTMRLQFQLGAVDITGEDFRKAFSLKSNWFSVTNAIGTGYHVLTRDGDVWAFGAAVDQGGVQGVGRPPARAIGAAIGGGYWILTDDGGVAPFGGAEFWGSLVGKKLNKPPLQLVPTVTGRGYWIVAADGGVFSFGDAPFHGSTGSMRLNKPVVGMASTPTGGGYWLVASDGGVFSFGDASFHGSTGSLRLNQPVNDIAATPTGGGYWLLAADGGLFSFGDATFYGSLPGRKVKEIAVDLSGSRTGKGYLIATAQGGIHGFGDQQQLGGPLSKKAKSPTVGAAVVRPAPVTATVPSEPTPTTPTVRSRP